MYNHEPPGYHCPFCRNLTTGASDFPLEFVHRDDLMFVKMNPKCWPRNPGSVLVIPNDHFENVYDVPVELGTPIQRAVRSVAIAMKVAFGCDGVSTLQHNEPDGNQDVWHYHVHVFPRWRDDRLYESSSNLADADELHTTEPACCDRPGRSPEAHTGDLYSITPAPNPIQDVGSPARERPKSRVRESRVGPRPLAGILYCNTHLEIHSSARRHGVDDLDIQHAVTHSLAIEDIGNDPTDGSSSAPIERAICSNSWSSSTSAARS